jgi:hypothetical protein
VRDERSSVRRDVPATSASGLPGLEDSGRHGATALAGLQETVHHQRRDGVQQVPGFSGTRAQLDVGAVLRLALMVQFNRLFTVVQRDSPS